MKLRIRDNSIRMRLTRGEVDSLHVSGRVAAVTPFTGGATLTYSVCTDLACDSPAAIFDNGQIAITLPTARVARWALSEDVSIRGEHRAGDQRLNILVEKDFACLSPRDDEEESDMFAHPNAGTEIC